MNQVGRGVLEKLGHLAGYDIRAALDVETLTVSGEQRVMYTNRHAVPLAEIYFNLYANAPRFGGQMEVGGVAVNGQAVEPAYEKERRALRVPLPVPLQPGDRALLEMSFTLHVPQRAENDLRTLVYSSGAFSAHGILSLAGWYPMLAVLDDAGWHLDYPEELIGEAMFSESAFYTVQMTLPQSLVVAATGVQVEESVHDDGTRTLTYRSGPVRTFYLAASQDYRVISGQMGEVAIHSYHLPGHERCGQWVLEAAEAALQLYGELYGPYLFAEFDVVEADYDYQGFEWPGLVLIGDMLYEGPGPACGEWFVAHETAHQWWYNVVGNDPVADPWLDEALAQYSTMLYFRRLWPADAAEAYVQAIIYDRYAPYANRPGGIHVALPTTAFVDRKDYYAITYARGAMFMEALNQALGDESFFAALQQYYQENSFQVARPEALREALDQLAPSAVARLWSEWVVARGVPARGRR